MKHITKLLMLVLLITGFTSCSLFDVDVDTTVTISRADYTLRMIRIENISFFSTLRNKLMWGADKRN